MDPITFGGYERRNSFSKSVVNLIGHLVGSGVLFISFYLVGWSISLFIHWLDTIHNLRPDISEFISTFEFWMIRADALLCGIVIFVGAVRFVNELRGM